MRMKKILSTVLCVMALLCVGSSAWAFSYNDHVSVAPNGKGDLLFVPLYVAADGWTTRIAIINTSTTRSTVAKIVVKSYYFSIELRDFLIYLSPADMWIGYLRYDNKTGKTEVFSTDSSVLYDSGIAWRDLEAPFASITNPLHLELSAVKCANDWIGMGYVEVIEGWSDTIAFTSEEKADKQKRGKRIATAYEEQAAAGIYNTQNILAGVADIDVEVSGVSWTASSAAVALKNYRSESYLTAENETPLGSNAHNNLREIDAALSKQNIALPFINNADDGFTAHMFTFPTKSSVYYQQSDKNCIFVDVLGNSLYAKSDYFPAGEIVKYNPSVFDNDEKQTANPFSPIKAYTLPAEVSIVNISTVVFGQGWINYALPNPRVTTANNSSGQPLSYTGAPVLPFIIDFKSAMSIKNGSYADGVVSGQVGGATVVFDSYQYSSSYATS